MIPTGPFWDLPWGGGFLMADVALKAACPPSCKLTPSDYKHPCYPKLGRGEIPSCAGPLTYIYIHIYYSYILKRGKNFPREKLLKNPSGSGRSLHPTPKNSLIKPSSAIFKKLYPYIPPPQPCSVSPQPWTAPVPAQCHPVSSLAIHGCHGFLLGGPLCRSRGPCGLWAVQMMEGVGGRGWDPGRLVVGWGCGPEGAEVCRGRAGHCCHGAVAVLQALRGSKLGEHG